jgi:hypothetical protein
MNWCIAPFKAFWARLALFSKVNVNKVLLTGTFTDKQKRRKLQKQF